MLDHSRHYGRLQSASGQQAVLLLCVYILPDTCGKAPSLQCLFVLTTLADHRLYSLRAEFGESSSGHCRPLGHLANKCFDASSILRVSGLKIPAALAIR